MQVAT